MKSRQILRWALCSLLALACAPVVAGEYNKKLDIGDKAPKFSELPGVDGEKHSLADFKMKDVLVLVVTCNDCPVARAYEDRLKAFTKKYAEGEEAKVAVVAVNPNATEGDKLEKMKERAKEAKFNFPYVRDESQELGRSLGASVTPEVFVFDKNRKLVYMGAIDDSIEDPETEYLTIAVDATLKGEQPEKAETRARGCGVKYSKKEK
jgi:peroxiredoxin